MKKKSNCTPKCMTPEEFDKWIERNGHKVMTCDTPVPYYNTGVSCGLPNDMGNIPPEMMMVPGMMTRDSNVVIMRAKGNSMEGVGINDGDLLMIEYTQHFDNDDIVIASIDGEETLKSYHVDEDGQQWLVPANDAYDPIPLTEEMNVRFGGRLLWQLRREPRDIPRHINQSIKQYKMVNKLYADTKTTPRVPTEAEVKAALHSMGDKVEKGRHWLGPCRILMDCDFIPMDRYDLFCELVRSELPNHQSLPVAKELSHMAAGCFSKPFDQWCDKKAPVHGKYYNLYYNAAIEMLKVLPPDTHQFPLTPTKQAK